MMQQPSLTTAATSSNETAEDATSLRERGNALYKAGRVQQAIDLYHLTTPEFYVYGHDAAKSLYDDKLASIKDVSPNDIPVRRCLDDSSGEPVPNEISLLFAGEYDPEHDAEHVVLSTIYYTYYAQVMPKKAWDVMQSKITQACEMLEGRASLPEWLVIPSSDRVGIIDALQSWQKEITEMYSTDYVQENVIPALESDFASNIGEIGPDFNTSLKLETCCFVATLALLPDSKFMAQFEPGLRKLVRDFLSSVETRQEVSKQIRQYVAQNWKVNPTFYDLEWERITSHIDQAIRNDSTTLQLLFFRQVAQALRGIKGHMQVTVSVGSIIDVLEHIRYVAVDGQKQGEPRSLQPRQGFDRIHLSNVPDYIGTSLFSYVFAIPLTKSHDASFVTYDCLRNPPQWSSISEFDCEALTLHEPTKIAQALNVEHTGLWEGNLDSFWPMGDYQMFKPLSNTDRGYDQLLSKTQLTQWLFALFFKLAMPAKRGHDHVFGNSAMVLAPLSMSMYLRLLIHLHSVGYPAHTLASILSDILENRVRTTSRPPTRSPLRPEEASRSHALTKLSTAPFVAEMSTLTSMFTRVLPFAPLVKPGTIPPLRTLRRCTVAFPKLPVIEHLDLYRPDFVIILLKDSVMARLFPHDGDGSIPMRRLLTDQKSLDALPHDLHVISTWKWDFEEQKATFWLREDVARSIVADKVLWRCEIWRTDNWHPADPFSFFKNTLQMTIGECWTDG
ncbi:hypothetical protein PMZ80_007365 [Knufia obscura]|uniref:Uncharacterized protein n=1 Tax=Knufia obscura TaxID=1635080 RepID=A0ABR0RH41_9EURO|nr:hypothetical protein PMZ80_007365 [Knufia obscura]